MTVVLDASALLAYLQDEPRSGIGCACDSVMAEGFSGVWFVSWFSGWDLGF